MKKTKKKKNKKGEIEIERDRAREISNARKREVEEEQREQRDKRQHSQRGVGARMWIASLVRGVSGLNARLHVDVASLSAPGPSVPLSTSILQSGRHEQFK